MKFDTTKHNMVFNGEKVNAISFSCGKPHGDPDPEMHKIDEEKQPLMIYYMVDGSKWIMETKILIEVGVI